MIIIVIILNQTEAAGAFQRGCQNQHQRMYYASGAVTTGTKNRLAIQAQITFLSGLSLFFAVGPSFLRVSCGCKNSPAIFSVNRPGLTLCYAAHILPGKTLPMEVHLSQGPRQGQ